VLLPAFRLADAELQRDPRAAQPPQALARHFRVRVALADPDAAHARREDGVCARRRAAVVAARLERDGERRARERARAVARAGALERHDLGVRAADRARLARAEHPVAPEHHGSDRRIREAAPTRPLCSSERQTHRLFGRHRAGGSRTSSSDAKKAS
jgi:hypothetical protein